MQNQIPTIDCSVLKGSLEDIQNTPEFAAFIKEFCEAIRRSGMVYLSNHGLDEKSIESANSKLLEFFKLPIENKLKYRTVDPHKKFFGYKALGDEVADETLDDKINKEMKESFDFCGQEAFMEQEYPTEVEGIQDVIMHGIRAPLVQLSKKLLRAFGVYMKLEDPNYLVQRHRAIEDRSVKAYNAVRANYYMPMEEGFELSENTFRMLEHKDWGSLTFLIQGQAGGLEARAPDGEWVPVVPKKGTILLNTGLMLEFWSGGLFPAVLHRVRVLPHSANVDRQTFGFFLQPDGYNCCLPLIPEQSDWIPTYPRFKEGQTHLNYFRERIYGTRAQ